MSQFLKIHRRLKDCDDDFQTCNNLVDVETSIVRTPTNKVNARTGIYSIGWKKQKITSKTQLALPENTDVSCWKKKTKLKKLYVTSNQLKKQFRSQYAILPIVLLLAAIITFVVLYRRIYSEPPNGDETTVSTPMKTSELTNGKRNFKLFYI